jgi:hypothetical protein
MKAPWVTLRDSVKVIAEFQSEGDVWSLELNPLIAGDVQLVLRIDEHPVLPFAMRALDGDESPFSFRGQVPRCASLTRQVVTRGGDQSVTIVAVQFCLARKHEEVIMVAGLDYKGSGTVTYMRFAETLRDDLYAGKCHFGGSRHVIPRVIHDHTVVTSFDFATGYRRRQIKGQKKWHEFDAIRLGAKAPHVEFPNTLEIQDRRRDEDTISITHVYDYISSLGTEAPRTLLQMNCFSHAWIEGPILLDTNERDEYKNMYCKGRRDPGDKDPRCKDFSEENIHDIKGFCRAFAPSGFVKVWGCLRHGLHGHVDAVADLADAEEMRTCPDGIDYNSREIAEKIRREAIPFSYLGNLIKKAGIAGFGAVPTTTSNYQGVGLRSYMFVDRSVHGKHLKWFERNFNVKADQWGYVDFQALL